MLKVALSTKNQIKSYHRMAMSYYRPYCDGKVEQQDTRCYFTLICVLESLKLDNLSCSITPMSVCSFQFALDEDDALYKDFNFGILYVQYCRVRELLKHILTIIQLIIIIHQTGHKSTSLSM